MNREIKFRARNNKCWIYCDAIINGWAILNENGGMAKINPETVGQYTGLHDKNGKEIWENDIVEITRECIYEKGIIMFKNGCFFIKSKENLLALYNCELNNYKVKVIGNIYDNPELLGGE